MCEKRGPQASLTGRDALVCEKKDAREKRTKDIDMYASGGGETWHTCVKCKTIR